MTKPKLRIIHHLHRTGGTLISKCLASLPQISLLSEINPGTPDNLMVLDPVFQANFWLRLLDDREARELQAGSFAEKIKVIHRKTEERGDRLIIRNWAYLDFFGRPFEDSPEFKLSITDALTEHFDLRHIVTVRHPIQQWMSWVAYKGSASASDFTFAEFTAACMAFHDSTAGMPCVRYEDFVQDPTGYMQHICDVLDLKYDEVFLRRWPYYHQISGDDNDRASGDWVIAPRKARKVNRSLLAAARKDPNYQALLRQYDYSG